DNSVFSAIFSSNPTLYTLSLHDALPIYDLRGLDLTSYRRQLGVVQQTPVLFTGTIRDNIRYGRDDATEEEVLAAARSVAGGDWRSEEHTSELQSREKLVCRLLLEKKKEV